MILLYHNNMLPLVFDVGIVCLVPFSCSLKCKRPSVEPVIDLTCQFRAAVETWQCNIGEDLLDSVDINHKLFHAIPHV